MPEPKVKPAATPPDLGPSGRKFFSKIARDVADQDFSLTAQEVAWLRSAAQSEDIIAGLDAAWREDGCPMTARGVGGALQVHPIVVELRAQRKDQALTLARVKIPDEPTAKPIAGPSMTPAEFGRRGATARWAKP